MRGAPLPDDPMDRGQFPVDPWRLVETHLDPDTLGLTETLFSVGNGYLGMRGNPSEGREAHTHGTFVNGFHETWPIKHAEAAFGFAKTGQTIVNAPDAKVMKLYVDDEPLILATADLEEYERVLDFEAGLVRRSVVWRTPAGKRVRVVSTRLVSMTERHLALMSLEVTMLGGSAPVVISSQLLNRQDGKDEYHVSSAAMGEGGSDINDPRKAQAFEERVLLPRLSYADDDRMGLGYVCHNSQMTIVVAADHLLTSDVECERLVRHDDDMTKLVLRAEAHEGATIRLEKLVAYHTSRGVPVKELSDRCDRTLDRARQHGFEELVAEQRRWYAAYWEASDVVIEEEPALQQAVRFNLFCLAQAAARADQQGVPAKGVTGSGYEGHYFWDTEIYVVPFLTYTEPAMARNLLHFRRRMLPAAVERAREMAQEGALFPWRTINGEEASAYYAAGTAQMHIDADVSYALSKYVDATGDHGFLARDGIDILIGTARLYFDLGFFRVGAEDEQFHIHGVTGPDEYTTVVNNNLFTNVMARYNLERAADAVDLLREHYPDEHAAMCGRMHLSTDEVADWQRAAAAMVVPFDEHVGIHPQDDLFLEREVWDLSQTPAELRPLLLHYHPLVIYRFQVLKQTDVVMALFLQGDRFTAAEKKADFEYYDPITTGDSTLSAVVQSVLAAEVGYHEMAADYFRSSLFVDLVDLHDNTVDGIHVASCGGVWAALVNGFAGMRDHGARLCFEPRLPVGWGALSFKLRWREARLVVRVTQEQIRFELDQGEEVSLDVGDTAYVVRAGEPVVVDLPDQGPRIDGQLGDDPIVGGHRADGTMITAGVPTPTVPADEFPVI